MINFPNGFLWGAATAAHQVEGNNTSSDWWAREHATASTVEEPSGDACDSYHRYAEDVELLAEAGLTSYRFSIEWARIEPEPGFFSRAAIDHYRRMVDCVRQAGLEPVVTLWHFTVPWWMRQSGSWHNPQAPDLFARYVETALPVIADGVRYVITVNEPNLVAMMAGAELPEHRVETGLPHPDLEVADTLYQAHRQAREVLSQVAGLQTGWAVAAMNIQSTGEPGADDQARRYAEERQDRFLRQAAEDDFVGLQAYTRTVVGPDGAVPVPEGVEQTLTGWEFYPQAAELGLRRTHELTGGIPIMITENGIATDDDSRRIAYTEGALRGVHAAIADGIEVLGYHHWSALDNYEWGSYRPTFGLIAVDRKTFVRTPKPSLGWLGEVARRNGLPD